MEEADNEQKSKRKAKVKVKESCGGKKKPTKKS